MKGSSSTVMAWRNLWRNRRRTLLTVSSIAFGTLLAVLFTGMGDASWTEMINHAARLGGGHVTLQHPGYFETPSLRKTVTNIDTLRKVALEDEDVERVVTRITGQLMLATARQSYAASFVAFDPEDEDKQTFSVMDSVVEGEMLESSRDKGMILGKRLAANLGAGLGRKVVYTMTDRQGEIVTGLARVSGIVSTGAPSLDGSLCMLPIDTVRDVLGYDADEAIQVALFVGDHRRSDGTADRLGKAFGSKVAALTWRETQPDLAGFISMKVSSTLFLEIVIMILIAAGIFNTLFVSVMERMREFGILMAIGFSPGRLFSLVVWESLWLGVVGLVAAAAITAFPYYFLYTRGIDMSGSLGNGGSEIAGVAFKPILRVDIFPENAVAIAAAILLATVLSGIYPAWRAGRVVPVESIRLV